jgi:hypothetical protein
VGAAPPPLVLHPHAWACGPVPVLLTSQPRNPARRTSAVAEVAFWDSVAAALGQCLARAATAAARSGLAPGAAGAAAGAALGGVLGPLLAELGADVAAVMGGGAQARARREGFARAVAFLKKKADAGQGAAERRCPY